MIKILLAMAALVLVSTHPALGHEGHEIDRDLLASKIRDRGHTCASVEEASEKSGKTTVIAVKCSDGNSYRLVVTAEGFEVTPTGPSSPAPPDGSE